MQRDHESGGNLSHLFIGVPTRGRRDGLARLLDSIRACDLGPHVIEVLVLENGSNDAEPVVDRVRKATSPRLSFLYAWSNLVGIAPNRNVLLSAALRSDADFMTMLDDDTTIASDWIDSAIDALDREGADYVAGRTVVRIVGRSDRLLARCAERRRIARTAAEGRLQCLPRSGHPATNNFMVRVSALAALGVNFDDRLPFAGGEDTRFFADLRRAGATGVHVENMVVTEWNEGDSYTLRAKARTSFGRGSSVAAWALLDAGGGIRRFKVPAILLVRYAVRILDFRSAERLSLVCHLGELWYRIWTFFGIIAGLSTGTSAQYKAVRA
jgi:GT2 family glycosyltransferase